VLSLPVALGNVDLSGGQPITAGTTGIQTQTKMCIRHKPEAFVGVIPYGL